jgi:hypothetical protein
MILLLPCYRAAVILLNHLRDWLHLRMEQQQREVNESRWNVDLYRNIDLEQEKERDK